MLWSAGLTLGYNTGFASRVCGTARRVVVAALRHVVSSASMSHQTVLILDFGSQVTQLIARRVREAHVYSEIHPYDVSPDTIKQLAPIGVILSGSHGSTYEDHQLRAPDVVWELGVPVLGICYGMHTMAAQLGGTVSWSEHREFGYAEVRAHGHTKLLEGL
jgi:GMP synthase (glutamine-hydrolysing)